MAAFFALFVPVTASPQGCSYLSGVVLHEAPAGALDFTGTEYAGKGAHCVGGGPPARLWELDNAASSICDGAAPGVERSCYEWLLNADVDLGLPGFGPEHWVSVNMQLSNMCFTQPASKRLPDGYRIVVESSFADAAREGTVDHRGSYLAATVVGCCFFNLDVVSDGKGVAGNIVPVVEIPQPVLGTPATWANSVNPAYLDVNVTLQDARSFGDAGHPEIIGGYKVLYKLGSPPLSSLASAYDGEVLDPLDPATSKGAIPFGTGTVVVTVPRPVVSQGLYLVTELIYRDATREVSSAATSAHIEVIPSTQPPALLRDDSIRSLVPRPDLAVIFPLPVYLTPPPGLPFADQVGLLTDVGRPLVFYGHTAMLRILLVAEKSPVVESVTIYP